MFALLKQQNEKSDCLPAAFRPALCQQKELEDSIMTNGQILLGSKLMRDEECCLVCGTADYEDDNCIGYCDKCGITVHLHCYGLKSMDSFAGEFVCDQCKVFGVQLGMQLQCQLCLKKGGVLMASINTSLAQNSLDSLLAQEI